MKILVFGASLRKGSWNKKFAAVAAGLLKDTGHAVDLADFKEFDMPCYDGDVETASGIPAGGLKLVERVRAAEAVVISTPEYNGSIPGPLKNAVDWVSRAKPMPWQGKPLLLIGASPGALGAVRSLWHTRVPFEVCGSWVYPDMLGLPRAAEAFTETGALKDPAMTERLGKLLTSFTKFAFRHD